MQKKTLRNRYEALKGRLPGPERRTAEHIGSTILREAGDTDSGELVHDYDALLGKLTEEGFAIMSTGSGPWIRGESRVVREEAYRRSNTENDGAIIALTTYKSYTTDAHTAHSGTYSKQHTPESYQQHVDQWQLTMSPCAEVDSATAEV